jgi:ABC-type multidrug transport system fused ATPase/permease subunit
MNSNQSPNTERNLGGRPAEPPGSLGHKLPPPDEDMLYKIPPELRQAWVEYMSRGFENNQVMFKRTLEAFMKPYQITVGMYMLIFLVGILFFAVAAYLGLTGNQPAVAISFGGLSVISFVLFFIRQPVQALEENLEFISWLGVAFNTYWTRLMYISNKETVQQDLKAATDDYSILLERIIDKRTKMRTKRPGGSLVEAVRGVTSGAADVGGAGDQEENIPSVQAETRPG